MKVLITGGCKNGKSTLAQQLCTQQGGQPFYVATMRARDAEDLERVKRHRQERAGQGFTTVECSSDIGRVADLLPRDGSILLDSTTALLADAMFDPQTGEMRMDAPRQVMLGLQHLLDRFADIVFVSDWIASDALVYDEMTEAYRKGLAWLDRELAKRCDTVVEMTFGQQVVWKKGAEGDDLP